MLKDRNNVRKIRNLVISLIAIVMILCFYIKVDATDLTQGTVKPIYRPEWEKVSSTINEAAKTISIELKGTASKSQAIDANTEIDYSSTVTTTLTKDDILVYVDGQLDGDVNGNGKLDAGENPSITKTLTQPADTTDIATATHTLTLSGFEEASRQTGKPYKEWHGNISLKILGRGKDTSTYDENILTDKYGNQNMMETDEDQTDGTWIDVVYEDAKTDHNTANTMFTDFIKPEYTYRSAETTINNTNETVTIIFDVVDKYFESTTLANLDASQITILIDGYNTTEINNYLDSNNHKQLTKVQDITYTVNGVANTKIGERYQLVLSGLDREDGYKFSGYMTLSFAAGAKDPTTGALTAGIIDKSGNLSPATSITIGKDDIDGNPGQDTTGNGIIVDVTDPIWELGTITPNDADKTVTVKLKAKDKYFNASTLSASDITVYANDIPSSTIAKDITTIPPTEIRETVDGVANQLVGYEYTLILSNLEPAGAGYTTFVPSNLNTLDEPTRSTHEYKYRSENGGDLSIKINGSTISDKNNNYSNETPFELGNFDFTKPEVYEVRKTQSVNASDNALSTLTIVFDVTDKNYDKTDLIGIDTDNDGDIDNINSELTIKVDGRTITDINIQSLTYKEIITEVDGVANTVVGHQYTLVLNQFEETEAQLIASGRKYKDYSGTISVHIAEGAAKDTHGNTLNTATTTISDFVDFIKPNVRYDYATGDIDYTGKTFTMVIEVIDKYFQNSPFANEVQAVLNDATKTTEQKNAEITTIIQNYLTIEIDGEDITDNPLVTKKIIAVENVSVGRTMNKTVGGVVKTLDPANSADAEHLIIGKRFTLEISNLQQDLVDVGDEYLNYSGVITVSVPANFATDTTSNGNIQTTITSGVDIPGGSGTGTVVDVVDPLWEIAGTVTASTSAQTAVLPVKGTDKYLQTIRLTPADITITVTSPSGVLEVEGNNLPTGMTLDITEDTSAALAYGKKYIVTVTGFTTDAYQVKITFAEATMVDQSNNKNEETDFILFSSLVETSTETAATSKFLSKNVADKSSLPERQKIEKVIFQDDLDGMNSTRWDVTELQDGTIWAWYTDADSDGLYEVYIGSYIIINANVNSSYLFSYIGYNSNCGVTGDTTVAASNPASKQLVENLELVHNDGVEDMSYMFQYFGYYNMKSLDLGSEFDTINVTNMQNMFYKTGYTNMTTLNLRDRFDTRKVTNMANMFSNCGYSAMTTLNLRDKFDTRNVQYMNGMFENCGFTKMTTLDLGEKFYTTKVTNMSTMFQNCGKTEMTTLDLGPNFTKIASTNTNMFTGTGKSGACTIFAPEAIYSKINSFKLNSAATTGTVSYTNGTINPVYRPEWEKVSSTLSNAGVMTITVKGSANKTFTNGSYTGTYLSDVTSPVSGFTVYIDGEAVTDITKNISVGTPTLNESTGATEVTATITLSNFPKTTRTTGKNFKDWAGNVVIQFDKGTLRDKYGSYIAADNTPVVNTFTDTSSNYIGSQNLAVIDIDVAGTTEKIEIKEPSLYDTETGNSTKMFVDDIKPEFTYEYTNTSVEHDTETVKVIFDVTDKYFASTTLATNTNGSLIEVIVDLDENANTPITKVLAKKTIGSDTTVGNITYKANGDIYYTTANGTSQKIGERYELTITGLDRGDGFSYSGPMTLNFPAGVITDKSGNTSDLMTITIGINETDGNTSTNEGGSAVVVDVVDPAWEIDNVDTNETTQVATMDIIATDKYYENSILTANSILVYVDGQLDGDANNNGTIDAGETPIITKNLTTAIPLPDATKGVKYTLTLGNWASEEYSGTVKFVIPAGTKDGSGNLTYGIIDESGNLSNQKEFILGHIDLVKPVIEKGDTTPEIEAQDAANKTETVLINVLDKYFDETDPLAPNELTVYIDGEEVAVDFTNSSSTGIDGTLTKVQDFKATVGGDPNHIVGQQYKLVLSNLEQVLRNSKEYKDYSGTVSVKVHEGAVKDIVVTNVTTGDPSGGNVNEEETLTADFVDYIKPDIKYQHQSSDVSTSNKTYSMTFTITDKYYTSGVLTTADIVTNDKIEVLMQNGQLDGNGDPIVYNLKNEPVTLAIAATPIKKTFNKTVSGSVVTGQEHTIGHEYTLTISNLEQLEIKTGMKTADYSGIITVSIDGEMIKDISNNGNILKTLTAGVNFVGGTESGTPVEVDVVDPIWERDSSTALAKTPAQAVNANATTGTASITVKGTDTYLATTANGFSTDDSTLTSDEIEVYVDGVKNTSITPVVGTVTPLTETRRVYNFQDPTNTETVQYGVQYTITVNGWKQSANQVKIKILEDAIKDETGNGNKDTELIIYNCLESAASETVDTGGDTRFLDGNGIGEQDGDGNPIFATEIKRNEIQQIVFVENLDDAPITVAADGTITLGERCWDVSAISDKSILAWTPQTSKPYTVYVGSDFEIFANQDASFLFGYIGFAGGDLDGDLIFDENEKYYTPTETETIKNIEALNVSSVTNMERMFYATGHAVMTNMDLGDNFDTSNVTNMVKMFVVTGAWSMTELDFGDKFDTTNVINMEKMFNRCGMVNMTSLILPSTFNTENVINMRQMFLECGYKAMISLTLPEAFDTSGVTDMYAMFYKCGYDAMTSLTLPEAFDTSSVTTMNSMFGECGYTEMTSLTLPTSFDTSNVTDMQFMFYKCGYTAMTSLTLSTSFDTSNVTNMMNMFRGCGYTAMEALNLGNNFDTSSVSNMQLMFEKCGYTKLKALDLGDKFYTTSLTNATRIFKDCGKTSMTTLDLGAAFTKIPGGKVVPEGTSTEYDAYFEMFADCGAANATIYAPESIYKSRTAFKLNSTDTTATPTDLNYTRGTINPIYRPEWTKVSSSLDNTTNPTKLIVNLSGASSKNQPITGTNVTIKYDSTVTTALTKDQILVYIDGELDGDTNRNGKLDAGETPFITKQLTQPDPATGIAAATHTLTLSGFEEAVRQSGKNFLEWQGNVAIKILGRGQDTSTYTANILKDTYGNQSMMETDETAGTWIDIKYSDGTADHNTNGTMFLDTVKPEFSYEYSTTNPDVNTGAEAVTVVFDVTDKFFNSTTLKTNTNGSLITVIVDEDENANTPITKVLTRIKDVWYNPATRTVNIVNPDATGTGTKVGERYQLVITGLDRGDGFTYSGPLTLTFPAEVVTDKSGNKSAFQTITLGIDEPNPDATTVYVKPSDLYDAAGTNANKLHIGDFVEYDAGNWTTAEINAIQTGLKTSLATANGAATLPTTNFQFGGFVNGASKNGNATSYNSTYNYLKDKATNTALTGWRVFDIDGDKITLISAGNPEDYLLQSNDKDSYISEYILSGKVNSGWTAEEAKNYKNRSWDNYINRNQSAVGATVLTKQHLDNWYTKYLGVASANTANNATFQKIYESANWKYQNMINNNSYWYLGTAADNQFMYAPSPVSSGSLATSRGNAYGVRVLVTLSADALLTAEKVGTKTITGGNTASYGGDQTYNVWGIKKQGITVDIVDPIWEARNAAGETGRVDITTDANGNVSATMTLIGKDKYFKESLLNVEDIQISVDGVADITSTAPDLVKTLSLPEYIKSNGAGGYVATTPDDKDLIGVRYSFSITGFKETDDTFFGNRADYNADNTIGRPYREYSGEMSISIPAGKLVDETGNTNNLFTVDLDHVDTLKPEVIKVSGTANVNASNNELTTYTMVFDIVDKYINSTAITTTDTSKIHVYLDGEEAPSMTKPTTAAEQNANSDKIFKEITNIETLQDSVNGTTQTVGYRYTLVLSGFEDPRTAIDYDREYTDWSGDLAVKIDANTAKDTSNVGNDETILYGNEDETTDKTKGVFVDYIKPDATYEYNSTQTGVSDVVDKDGKTYTMIFDMTDKYFQTNNLDIDDFTILMSAEEETGSGEDGYYDLMANSQIGKALSVADITNDVVVDVNADGTEVIETKVIGKRYTLRISNLEKLQRVEGNQYLDYSGSITIAIPAGKVLDTSGNGNDATSITSGIDIPGGEVTDITEIDVVQPLWERTSFTTDIHNKTATITLKGTDKYFYGVDDTTITTDDGYGILTLDEIEVWVDGSKVTVATGNLLISDVTKLYEQRLVQTEYSDGDVDTGYTTETVQYGVQYTVTLKNFDIDKKQVKVRLKEGSLVDQSGNLNRQTELLVYNTLREAKDAGGNRETEGTSGFLGNGTIRRWDIDQIEFVSNLNSAPTIDGSTCWDVSAQRDNSILAWKTQTTAQATKGVYTVYIGSNDPIFGNVDSSYLFAFVGGGSNATATETIKSLNLLDTRNVTNMSHMFLCCGHNAMTSLILPTTFDTRNVTDMQHMFDQCGYKAMTSLTLPTSFDTSKVTNMDGMFAGTGNMSMTEFSLGSNFDTRNVTTMEIMFAYCGYTSITSLNLGAKFDTSKVTNMRQMFSNAGHTAMQTLNLGNNFNTNLVTNMQGMFYRCGYTAMTSLNLGEKFDTSKITNMGNMFRECGYTAMTSLNLGNKFDTSKVTDMQQMFRDCGFTKLTVLDLGDKFYTTSVTNTARMFKNCGKTAMTTLDLGAAFTKIPEGMVLPEGAPSEVAAYYEMFSDCGTTNTVIFASEQIYNDRTHFKLDTNSATTIEYTRGTINPVYKPEWEKVSTSVDVDNKEITVTFKGYANETFTNGTYTGSYSSPITSLITPGNDASNLLVVKVDGEVAEEITQTITQISETKNADNEVTEVQYTIKLSGFEETARRSGKNFKEWSGNIAVQPKKGTLIDKYGSYTTTQTVTNPDGSTETVQVPVTNVFTDASGNYIGNKNMIAIDDSTGKWTDIEFRDVTQEGSTSPTTSGNWTGLEDTNTTGVMFTDYIKPEFTYEYYNTTVDTNANTVIDYTNNKVTVVFDVTDKYFASTTLATDTTANLITVEVDNDADANTAITKTLAKKTIATEYTNGNIIYETDGDICYTINGVRQKIGERYELVIENLESSYGVGYSGIMTLNFPAGVITDKSGNTSALKTITIGIDEPTNPDHDGNPSGETDHTGSATVDVVNPVWSYADSDIDRVNDQVNVYIIGSDKHYKQNTLTTGKITVYVDNSATTVDTDRNGTADANVSTITKNLTDITAEMQQPENAARLAELIAGAGLTDKMTADNNLTAVGVIYKLTLSNFGTISGQTKVVLNADTIEDTSGNKNTPKTIEVGNVTWEETNEPLESGDAGYPRYPAFRNDIVDFRDPIITYTHSTVEVDTDGNGTPDTTVSENPDIDYEDKIVTVKFQVTDKYLLESDLIETITNGDGSTTKIPKNITLIIDETTIYTNDGNDATTDIREVTTEISSTDIANGKEYTLVVRGLQKYEYPDNEGFTYSGPMDIVFTPGVIDDTSGNKNSSTTITLDTMYDDIVDVVDPVIKYVSSNINRATGTVTLRLIAEDKYLDIDRFYANVNNATVKIVDFDGNEIVNDTTTISKSISKTITTVGGYTKYNYTITLTGFETDTTIATKNRETDTLIKGITSFIIPADLIFDTSGNGNVETTIPVGSPTDVTAFKDSIVDCVSPIWEYDTSSIDRDRYDNDIDHNQTGTVTVDIIGTDKFFDNTYFTDSSKQLTVDDIKVYVNNVENTTIQKSLNTNPDGSVFKEQITRTMANGSEAPFGVRYRLLLSNFEENDGAVRIEIADDVIRDTSYNVNADTPINVGNPQWVEDDEPLESGDAGYPKYPAFRTNIVDFINPIVTYTYSNVAGSENPKLDRTDLNAEKLYIKFDVTDTNFLESNIGVEDLTIYADIDDGNGNSEMDITTLLNDRSAIQLSTPTSITNAGGAVIGKSYIITLSQMELADLIDSEVFLRHSGRIRFVVAEGQVEDTSGNKNVETSLIVDYGDGTNTGTDEDDYVIVDFVDPIIKYHSKFMNWNERYATITLRATDRFYDMNTELEPSDLTLYELNEDGEWINITSQFYNPSAGVENITITKTPVKNADGYQYGYDFIVRLDDFEEEFKMKIAIKAGELGDSSGINKNKYTEIQVNLDNRKPKWEYVSTDTTNFTSEGKISFTVKGVDKFLDIENSKLEVIQEAEGVEASTDVRVLLDGEDITNIPNITITHISDDEDNSDDGERSKTYKVDVTGLTEIGTYSLVFEKETLVDELINGVQNKSAATTITFSQSDITGNTGNYTNITYHVSPDNNQVHSSFVHEMMSLNTTGTNFEGTASSTFKPSSLGELNNDGENPLFAEPMYREELEADGYTVKYVYAPKSFAGWAEADEKGNIITGGTTYGLYDNIPNTKVHLKAVWQNATVVFVSDSSGDNSKDGKLPENAVKDMETAFSKLDASGTVGNNIIVIMDTVEWSSGTTLTKPATITSLYAGVDYRKSANAELKISSNITTNADITFDNIKLYTTNTTVSDGSDYLANGTYSNMLIANYANVILGRRVTTPSGKYTFGAIIGGNYKTETATGTIGTHTIRVEAGRYNNIIAGSALQAASGTAKTVTHNVEIGNMREAAIARNDNLTITGYVAMGELTGATNVYAQDYSIVTLYNGVFTGENAFNKSSEDVAIYMRSLYGSVGGKTQFEMYSGEVNGNIYAGSGKNATANSNVIINTMKFYGGKVVGNIFGQGVNDAFIGTSDITLTGKIEVTNNVFGGSNVTTAGQGNGTGNTNITIESMSATVGGNIYGGSNGLSNSGYLTGITNITVNAGTLTNIYGSGNNAGNSGNTNIIINNGTVSGKIVGGAYKGQTGGTANITVVGGIVTGNIIGGNENTTQAELDSDMNSQNAVITIGTTDEAILTIPTINGIIYGGGVFDAVGTTTIQLIEAQNTITAVYGASNTNSAVTQANITLNGATVGVIYGGGNGAGTVGEANINLTSGTVTSDVYGGGYAANVGTTNVTLQGTASVTDIYGGSNTSGSVTTANVILTSGNVTNAFGGGYLSNVGTANITLNGITIDELHGGSKDAGTVGTSNVTLTSGTVGTVFGGGLDSNVGTSTVKHNGTAVVTTIYGGNNSGTGSGGTVGTSNVNIVNTQVANVYGGNYLKGTTSITNINIQGTSTITGKLFGGGYKTNIATSSAPGSTTINVTGGTINCDINGGSEEAVVYGTTSINIGKDAVEATLTNGNISIGGNIYGAGSSNLAANRKRTTDRTQYNYNYVSVVGTTNIVLDASLTTPIVFSGSIYGAGNGSTYSASPDTSRIFIKDFGSSTNAHQITSIERTGRLFIGNSFVELLGNSDINNENRKASYTLNRIANGLTVYDNTTVYTRRGFNVVGGFNSFTTISEVTGNGTKASVTVRDGAVYTQNVDNRIYTFEGVNLIFSKQEVFNYATATSDVWGEVNGMTFFGMYALDTAGNKALDIYDPQIYNSSYEGTLVEKYFVHGTFIEGLHETNHLIGTDGFYTVTADYDTDTVEVEVIQPTPESATYYDWLIGADRITYEIALIGSILGDQATAELELDYKYLPNATYTFDRVSLNALDLGVNLINPLDINVVSEDANDTFGLTVETDVDGWLNRGKTNIYTQKDPEDTTLQQNGSFGGDKLYKSDNTTTPGTIKFKLYNSLNITETKDLGYVNILLTGRTPDPDDPDRVNTFIIVIAVNLQTEAAEQVEDYLPKFTDTSATELSYTSDSRVDLSYVLFKNMASSPYTAGDYRVISTSKPLPSGTKLTLKDYGQGNNTKVYYYHVTNSTTYTTDTSGGTTRYLYRLSDIFEMASTNAKYQDSTSYYHSGEDGEDGYVLEKYDLSIDFIDSGIATNELAHETYLELRNSSGAKKYDNADKIIKYNLYSTTIDAEGNTIDANALFTEILSNEGQTYSVIDNTDITFSLDVSIQEQLTSTGEKIKDTKYYGKIAGIVIEVLTQDGVRVQLPDAQNVKIVDLDTLVEYPADESGVIRIPLFEGLSSMHKNYKFSIAQSSVPPGTCDVKVYFFTSDDGKHFGNEEKVEKEFYAIFINRLLGLVGVEATEDSRIINKETLKNLENNLGIDMTVSVGDATAETNVRVELYKRNPTYDGDGNYTGTEYTQVDLKDYLSGTWTKPEEYGLVASGTAEYMFWRPTAAELAAEGPSIDEIEFQKELKNTITTGEYKVVFKSYFNNILVQTVRKTFIVTE